MGEFEVVFSDKINDEPVKDVMNFAFTGRLEAFCPSWPGAKETGEKANFVSAVGSWDASKFTNIIPCPEYGHDLTDPEVLRDYRHIGLYMKSTRIPESSKKQTWKTVLKTILGVWKKRDSKSLENPIRGMVRELQGVRTRLRDGWVETHGGEVHWLHIRVHIEDYARVYVDKKTKVNDDLKRLTMEDSFAVLGENANWGGSMEAARAKWCNEVLVTGHRGNREWMKARVSENLGRNKLEDFCRKAVEVIMA